LPHGVFFMPGRLSSIGLRVSFALAIVAAAPGVACSGVVVDGNGGAGAAGGGQGGNGAGSGSGSGAGGSGAAGNGGGGACAAPALVGDLDSCAAPGGNCGDATVCDAGGNKWQAKCTEEGCACNYNDQQLCACAFDVSPCAGAAPDDCCALLNQSGCCPYPWLNHPGCKGTGQPCTQNADCCAYLCSDGTCDP
jgi:hypothetical protein